VAALVPAREFRPKPTVRLVRGRPSGRDALPPGGSGVVPPEKGEAMDATYDVLTTALLVALLIIDRLTR
jgi:hypothetical protein